MHGVFVSGTDTNVGKSVVCAAMMHRLRPHIPVRYWKPVQTGAELDDDAETVRVLGECGDGEIVQSAVRLPRPLSPHLAARLAGTRIDVTDLLSHMNASGNGVRWIIEGAGGVLVPLNERDLMVDLMVRIAVPVLVVARTALGTINHTLLTLHALRARKLDVMGVVMVGDSSPDNRAAIEEFGAVPVLGELRRLEVLTAGTLRMWALYAVDPEGRLLSCGTRGGWLREIARTCGIRTRKCRRHPNRLQSRMEKASICIPKTAAVFSMGFPPGGSTFTVTVIPNSMRRWPRRLDGSSTSSLQASRTPRPSNWRNVSWPRSARP
jgi:dethiobiotin synthetase/malonyl-CoA O-methyltransferase